MKNFLILTIALFFSFYGCAQDKGSEVETEPAIANEPATYYLIRHAEKDRSDPTNKDPNLTQQGLLRAVKWSYALGHVEFDAIYSTNYNRTMETAMPTAEKNGISELTMYDPRNMDIKAFLDETQGKTLLIVGHSNTTPDFVNKLLGSEKYEQIDDSNNANLYIVHVSATGEKTDYLLVID